MTQIPQFTNRQSQIHPAVPSVAGMLFGITGWDYPSCQKVAHDVVGIVDAVNTQRAQTQAQINQELADVDAQIMAGHTGHPFPHQPGAHPPPQPRQPIQVPQPPPGQPGVNFPGVPPTQGPQTNAMGANQPVTNPPTPPTEEE